VDVQGQPDASFLDMGILASFDNSENEDKTSPLLGSSLVGSGMTCVGDSIPESSHRVRRVDLSSRSHYVQN
jgi:hypothetical protein